MWQDRATETDFPTQESLDLLKHTRLQLDLPNPHNITTTFQFWHQISSAYFNPPAQVPSRVRHLQQGAASQPSPSRTPHAVTLEPESQLPELGQPG